MPLPVLTTTTAGPTAPGGVTAVSDVPPGLTVTSVAGTPSKVTPVSPGTRPVPVIVTVWPPDCGPTSGVIDEAVGDAATYVNPFGVVTFAPGTSTVTSTGPTCPAA